MIKEKIFDDQYGVLVNSVDYGEIVVGFDTIDEINNCISSIQNRINSLGLGYIVGVSIFKEGENKTFKEVEKLDKPKYLPILEWIEKRWNYGDPLICRDISDIDDYRQFLIKKNNGNTKSIDVLCDFFKGIFNNLAGKDKLIIYRGGLGGFKVVDTYCLSYKYGDFVYTVGIYATENK